MAGRHVAARGGPGDGHLSGVLNNPGRGRRSGAQPCLFPGKTTQKMFRFGTPQARSARTDDAPTQSVAYFA